MLVVLVLELDTVVGRVIEVTGNIGVTEVDDEEVELLTTLDETDDVGTVVDVVGAADVLVVVDVLDVVDIGAIVSRATSQ